MSEASEADNYLIWSNEHRSWWRPNRAGYTSHVSSAGRYTRTEALSICWGARDGWPAKGVPSEVPVLADDAIACLSHARAMTP